MTSSPSEPTAEVAEGEVTEPEAEASDPVAVFAARVAETVDAIDHSSDFGTAKVTVASTAWAEAVRSVRDELGLVFFSYLSAIDWSNDVAVGDPLSESVDERYELLCGLSDITDGNIVHLSTSIPKGEATVASITSLFPGADWHEREAAEMFGITFEGHPNPGPLYLPDAFEGHPLQKSYPLLSREVKPWPGKVDVENMPSDDADEDDAVEATDGPSTENPEA